VTHYKVPYQHLSGGTEENHKNICQDSQFLSRYFSQAPTKYEAGNRDARRNPCSQYSGLEPGIIYRYLNRHVRKTVSIQCNYVE
jgi:hypothetical protein